MNKEKFLTELRGYLNILENQEQEDILEEYAQHIDMKMQKGLSEEEAIRDFGSIGQLAAEILEAYHVKPELSGISSPRKGSGGKSFLKEAGGRSKAALIRALHGIRNGFRWLGAKCRVFAAWFTKPFTRREKESGEEAEQNRIKTERAEKMNGRIGKFFRAVGHGIAALWKWLIGFCIVGLKFMWNAAWLLFAIFCACMAMIALMGVGAVPILLSQGYPLVGVLIICIGGLLCLCSLAYGAFSMLIRKKDDKDKSCRDENKEKSGKEAVYEQTA